LNQIDIGLMVVAVPVALAAAFLIIIEFCLQKETPKPAAPTRAPIYLRFRDSDRADVHGRRT